MQDMIQAFPFGCTLDNINITIYTCDVCVIYFFLCCEVF